MAVKFKERHEISINGTYRGYVDFSDMMESSETITGTPTIVEVGTSALTLRAMEISTVTSDVTLSDNSIAYGGNGQTVPANKGVKFEVVSDTAGVFTVRATATTNLTGSIDQVLIKDFEIEVID